MTISINGFNEVFPDEIKQNIFINLGDSELEKCRIVCKEWQKLVTDEYFLNSLYPEPAKVFGGNQWKEYLGNPGKVLRLRHIEKTLEESCPIYKGKKIKDTHFLFFRPATLDGNPLTLIKIGELLPWNGGANGFQNLELPIEEINTPLEKGEWILMTKDVLPSSGDINHSEQLKLIEKLSEKARVKYYPLTLKDAITGMFLYELISNERLYPPFTYTSCQKEESQKLPSSVTVSFGPKGINVRYLNKPDAACGIGAMRKIKANSVSSTL